MGRISILILLFFSSLSSCRNYYINEKGGYRPKRPKFEFAKLPYQLKEQDLIDTASVYVSEGTVFYGEEARKIISYFIFFSNGRCYEGRNEIEKPELTLTTLNNFNKYGSIGYFKLNQNKIEIELYTVTLGGARGNVGYYTKNYGYIKNDSIYFFINPKLDIKDLPIPNDQNCVIYIRQKMAGLTGTPDW